MTDSAQTTATAPIIKTPVIKTKVLIIGSGPAGYTAAIYAARANLSPVMAAGNQPGGQLTITTDVENYPGFADMIQGPWLMDQMRTQAERVGTTIHNTMIQTVDLNSAPKTAVDDAGNHYEADTVIVATGAQARWLGMASETKFQGYGVSGCATCDGFFYKGHDVAVIGGGNTAVEEALFLTNFASSVTLIHRRDSLRAEKMLQDQLFAHPKIKVLWHQTPHEFVGTEDPLTLTGLMIKSTKDGTISRLDVTGAFVAIGHDPATAVFKGQLDMDQSGYIITNAPGVGTNIPGVFAAGDVHDQHYRQAVTAAGFGCMAALDAERYLAAQK